MAVVMEAVATRPGHRRTSTLVILDPGVADAAMLAAGVVEGAIAHILEAERDGVEQITELLQGQSFSEVHIVAHGMPGCLKLGNGELSLSTLDRHRKSLQRWFASTFEQRSTLPQLWLYGCELAAGDAGAELVEKLHWLTGANLAASNTVMGAERLGGNWEFEVTWGEVQAEPAFTPETLAAFNHTLPVLVDGFEQSTYLDESWLGITNKLTVDHKSGSLYLATRNNLLYQLFPDKSRRVLIEEFEERFYPEHSDIQFYNGKIYGVMGNSGSLREIDLNAGTDIEIAKLAGFGIDAGLAIHQGKIYISDGKGDANALRVFDLATRESSLLITGLGQTVSSVEIEPITGEIYFSTVDGEFYQATPNDTGAPQFQLIAAVPSSRGEFAIDPNGEYLYATTNQGKIERIAIADGSLTTFSEGLGGVEEGDLVFAQSSTAQGLSLYVLSGDSRIEEISGFARPESGLDVAIPGLKLSTRYEGDLDDANTLTVDPQTGNLYSLSDGSLFQLSSDGTVTQAIDSLEFPYLQRDSDIQFYEGSVYAYFDGYDGLRQLNAQTQQDPNPQNPPNPQEQGLVQFPNYAPRGSGLDIARGKIYFTEESAAGDRIRTFDLRTQELATLVDGLLFSPDSLEIDPSSGNVYFSSQGEFYVIDPTHWDGVENGYRSLRTSFLPTASGEFAIGPAGKYLYAISDDDKIWRIATKPEYQGTTGGPELVADGLVGIHDRDLAFGPSSSPWGGSSLYVLGKDNFTTGQDKIYEISGFDNPVLAKPLPNLDEDRNDLPGIGNRPRLTIDPTRRNFYTSDTNSLTLTSYFDDSLTPYLDSRMPYWRGQSDFPLAGLSDANVSLSLTEQSISETEIQFYQGFVYALTDDGSLRKFDPKTQANVELGILSDFGADAGIDVLNDKVYISDGEGRANEIVTFDLNSQSFETFLTDIPEDVSNVEVDAFNNLIYFSAWERQEPGSSFKLSFYQANPEGMGYRRVTQLNSYVSNGDPRLQAGAFTVGPRGEYLYTAYDRELHRIAIDTGLVQTLESERWSLDVGEFGDLAFAPSLDFNPDDPTYSLFVAGQGDFYELKGIEYEQKGFLAPLNRLPEPNQTIADQTVEENQPFSLVLPEDLFVDLDREQPWLDVTIFEDDQLLEWLTFDPVTRTLSGTPSHSDVVDGLPLAANAWDRPGFRDDPDASIVFRLTVTDVNNPPTGEVTLSDSSSENVAIAATTTLEDADSMIGALRYQWEQATSEGWEPIAGATSDSFTPDDAQVGKQLRLQVSYTDGGDLVEMVYSQPTEAIANLNDVPSLTMPLADQAVEQNEIIDFSLPSNSFSDVDANDTLTYQAFLVAPNNSMGSPLALPDWLRFDADSQRFSGTATELGTFSLLVTATDGSDTAAEDRFELTVNEAVVIPALNDFNGDQFSDSLWRNSTTGALRINSMDGMELGEKTDLPPAIADDTWQVQAIGDFDGDQSPNLIWRNPLTGQTLMWDLDNQTAQGQAQSLARVSDPNWQILGSGQFNGDAKTDLVWYNIETQATVVWYMDGATTQERIELEYQVEEGDRLEAVGDFDGNGSADLLLHNPETEANRLWLMDGTTRLSDGVIESLEPGDWSATGIGDYNRDGRADIAWFDGSSQQYQLWLMDGVTVSSQPMASNDQGWSWIA